MLWPIKRRPKAPAPPSGPAIQHAEQHAAKIRLLAMARQRQADHLYDGLAR